LTATKILWGQILVVFAIVLATMWAATQWTAWRLGFQPQLGPPWFELAGAPVYLPPAFFWWWYHFDAYAPSIFLEGAIIAASGGFAAIGIAIGMSVWRAREAKDVTTYGSARWATRNEVRAAGLLNPDGVVLGRFARDYLRHDGPEHVLCFAPPTEKRSICHLGRRAVICSYIGSGSVIAKKGMRLRPSTKRFHDNPSVRTLAFGSLCSTAKRKPASAS
jgi:type IV secretory pathway TraG/TraD family ATPase VirD4